MSNSAQKKMRKLVRTSAQVMQTQMLAQMRLSMRDLLKPKPKWMPTWFYRRLITLVLNQKMQ